MKKFILLLVFALCIGIAKAEVFNHTFSFNENDFAIEASQSDSLIITSLSVPSINPNITEPKIPILVRSIAIPSGCSISDFTYSISKRLIRQDVDLINSLQPIPASMLPAVMPKSPGYYAPKIYPDSNCIISSTRPMGAAQVVDFRLVPYVFDAQERSLYFVDSVTVHLELVEPLGQRAPARTTARQYEDLMLMVENLDFVKDLDNTIVANLKDDESYSYLIITNEALKSTFKPLADWKRAKGVPSKIITVEEIEANYTEETQQMRIKSCIQDEANNHGVMFVLLGGDNSIIPVQYCDMYIPSILGSAVPQESKEWASIPADVYYACIGQLDWDTNNDGRFGLFGRDIIDINPNLDIARLPVDNMADCETVVNRIIQYEKDPKILKTFFQAGTRLEPLVEGEKFADAFYNKVINGKIIIERDKLFISTPNVTGFGSQFTPKLSRGPLFAQIICHGIQTAWCGKSGSFFTSDDATTLLNPNHTFISTNSCWTNAFDDTYTDLCLSEALIRNPGSGVIGYMGSSRFGWNAPAGGDPLDYSMAYETDFYERLFNLTTQKPYTKSFGSLLSTVKRTLRNLAEADFHYRWLHLSINAIGDPETPIFTGYPMNFTDASFTINDDNTLTVNTGVSDARICVSGVSSPEYYAISYGDHYTFDNMPKVCDIWITKQDYIPKHFKIKNLSPENPEPIDTTIVHTPSARIISATPNPVTDRLTVRFTALSSESTILIGLVPIMGGNSYIIPVTDRIRVEEDMYETTIDVSIPQGVYVLELLENGSRAQGSRQIIKN